MGILEGRVTVKVGDARLGLLAEDWAWTGEKDPAKLFKLGDIVYVHVDSPPGAPVLHGTLEQDSGAQRGADGGRQRHGRRTGDGGRPRLQPVAVQPRDAGRAADRLVVQAVCLYGCD